MYQFTYAFSSALIIYIAYTALLSKRLKWFQYILLYLYDFAIIYTLQPKVGQVTSIFLLLGTEILIFIFYKYKISNCIISLIGYLISICFNSLIMILLENTLGISVSDLAQSFTLLFNLVFAALIYIILRVLRWLLNKKLKYLIPLSNKKIQIAFLIQLMICATLYIVNIISGEVSGYPPNVIYVNSILFFSYFICSSILLFYTSRTILSDAKSKSQLIQYANLQEYTQKVEEVYLQMRMFKHDYMTLFLSMKNYIDEDDMKGLKKYYYSNILPVSAQFSKTDAKLGSLSNIKTLELKSLLSAKCIFALENGITLRLEILDPIAQVPMDSSDLLRVIGIFLDNAIEAALDSPKKELRIAFIINQESSLQIIIRNSCLPIDGDVLSLMDSGRSTKGSDRGLGLYNAQKILSEYPDIIWTMNYSEGYFMQGLEFFKS